ncbi:MAG: tetratricopeptide repeat protein, partial [Planctomycetales bacterium]|nr:tetratricopeptide repeat protein [Planctomycetales bacterium]
LEMLAHDSRIVFRDQHGLIAPASGQRLLGFDDDSQPTTEHASEARSRLPMTDWTPSRPHEHWRFRDWFDQGRELLEEDAAEESIEAFRMCLMERPDEAEAHFHLAEALYRCGRSRAALERYHAAVEHDHGYIEAWTQLGCLHAELDEHEAALDAFEVALEVHPDFPDAHWHKGEILHGLDRTDEAIPHWERYLTFDNRGPWAETARQRLNAPESVHDIVAVDEA